MAELTAQNLYDQLTPMSKLYYDQQFKKQYTPGKENILLSSQPEYNKMKAVYEAEQQVPKKSLLDSINIFSSASAAEPDKISSVSGTPGFQTVANPDGTISIVPVDTSSSLPFNVGDRLFNQFNTATTIPNQTSFDPRSIQSIFPTNFPKGIVTGKPLLVSTGTFEIVPSVFSTVSNPGVLDTLLATSPASFNPMSGSAALAELKISKILFSGTCCSAS